MGHLRAAVAIWILLGAALGWPQSAPPAFDVASIKLHEFPPGMTGLQVGGPAQLQISGTRLSTFGSLPMLVMTAYNRHLHEVSGGPQWTDREGNPLIFDIQARAGGDAALSLEQARQMMQALLADRFQLKVHQETREVPIYEFTVDKNGPKLKEAVPGADSKSTSGFSRGIWKFRYPSISVADLAARIASNFDRPLVDRTGLKGTYDITMEYRRPGVLAGLSEAALPMNADTEPSIFSALQQLGLKLVRAKGPIEITVIDHAEKPSGN